MGVPQSLATSYKWFAIAAKTGDTDAATKRDEVANAMEASELAAAQDQVQNWTVVPLDVATNKAVSKKEWQGNATGTAADTTKQARVKQAQSLLNQRGFSVGQPDGLIGPKTSKAIMEFQRSAGLPITGKVDDKLLKALELQT